MQIHFCFFMSVLEPAFCTITNFCNALILNASYFSRSCKNWSCKDKYVHNNCTWIFMIQLYLDNRLSFWMWFTFAEVAEIDYAKINRCTIVVHEYLWFDSILLPRKFSLIIYKTWDQSFTSTESLRLKGLYKLNRKPQPFYHIIAGI